MYKEQMNPKMIVFHPYPKLFVKLNICEGLIFFYQNKLVLVINQIKIITLCWFNKLKVRN